MTPARRLRSFAAPTLRRWGLFLAGAATGLAAAAVLGLYRGGAEAGTGPREGSTELPADVESWPDRALAGAAWGLDRARDLLTKPAPLDLVDLERRVAALPSGRRVRVRALGSGIVEVVGSAPDDEAARAVLETVEAAPGVEVVVNRVWTPSSAVRNVSDL